jgi:hypothetical protein
MRGDRHLQHDAGLLVDRQEGRIGLRALFAQRRQHDRHHLLEMREHAKSASSKRPVV